MRLLGTCAATHKLLCSAVRAMQQSTVLGPAVQLLTIFFPASTDPMHADVPSSLCTQGNKPDTCSCLLIVLSQCIRCRHTVGHVLLWPPPPSLLALTTSAITIVLQLSPHYLLRRLFSFHATVLVRRLAGLVVLLHVLKICILRFVSVPLAPLRGRTEHALRACKHYWLFQPETFSHQPFIPITNTPSPPYSPIQHRRHWRAIS
jgi:hypothetical protein